MRSRELAEGGAVLRELSLHILDLIENAIRAGASIISVTIREDHAEDSLEIIVEDNGPGLKVPLKVAVDPFYTTKSGKRTGLGLSLFRFRVEQADGRLTMDRSDFGGLAVKAVMRLSHIDRSPLGDLASTFSSVVCTNPGLDLRFRICVDDSECEVKVSGVASEISPGECCGLTIARNVHKQIEEGLSNLRVVE